MDEATRSELRLFADMVKQELPGACELMDSIEVLFEKHHQQRVMVSLLFLEAAMRSQLEEDIGEAWARCHQALLRGAMGMLAEAKKEREQQERASH